MKTAILKCRDDLWEGGEKNVLSSICGGRDLIVDFGSVNKVVEIGIRIGTSTNLELLERQMQALIPFERFIEPFDARNDCVRRGVGCTAGRGGARSTRNEGIDVARR
jgi:hypothetical protein